MSTAYFTDKLLAPDPSTTPGEATPSVDHRAKQQARPLASSRTVSDLLARHPELVANLVASLNPTPPPLAHDVALFQSAVLEIQRAAVDGVLTTAEARLLIMGVIEGFTARWATESISSAIRSAFSLAEK